MDDEDFRVSVLANEQDVHLLREIARWRRNGGQWTYFQWRPGRNFGALTEWSRFESDRNVKVSYDPGGESRLPGLTVTTDYRCEPVKELPVRTVAEAVDVLVALGFLPARFSSAYLAGWSSRSTWDGSIRLSDDLGQPLVPAVEPAW